MSRELELSYQGRTFTLRALAAEVGVPATRIYSRLRRGLSVEEAISTPVAPKGWLVTAFGTTRSTDEWALIKRLPRILIEVRIAKGWPPEKALTTPAKRAA